MKLPFKKFIKIKDNAIVFRMLCLVGMYFYLIWIDRLCDEIDVISHEGGKKEKERKGNNNIQTPSAPRNAIKLGPKIRI